MENTMVTLVQESFQSPNVWKEMVTYARMDRLWCKILWEQYFI